MLLEVSRKDILQDILNLINKSALKYSPMFLFYSTLLSRLRSIFWLLCLLALTNDTNRLYHEITFEEIIFRAPLTFSTHVLWLQEKGRGGLIKYQVTVTDNTTDNYNFLEVGSILLLLFLEPLLYFIHSLKGLRADMVCIFLHYWKLKKLF